MSNNIGGYIGYIKRGFTTDNIHINNNLTISGDEYIDGDLYVYGKIHSNQDISGDYWDFSNNNIYNTNTGNVGIGVTNPLYKLDVSGETRIQTNKIKIGIQAGNNNQGDDTIGIGFRAGANNQGNNSIGIGLYAGTLNQGNNSIGIGNEAASDYQGNEAIAIGVKSGGINQGEKSIAIGYNSGFNNQDDFSIAVGYRAGEIQQGFGSVAIGYICATENQGDTCIAIGCSAGDILQNTNAIAIGNGAGYFKQGTSSISIGVNAGNMNQKANSIVIDACGNNATIINGDISGACYIRPIRQAPTYTGYRILMYNDISSEVVYSTALSNQGKTFIIDHPINNDKYLVHACLEGPESGVYYRGTGEITNGNKMVIINLPDYVSSFATDLQPIVSLICDDGDNICNLCASRVDNGSFKVYRNPIMNSDTKFNWIVTGKRGDIKVEPYKDEISIRGDGPYKYYESL